MAAAQSPGKPPPDVKPPGVMHLFNKPNYHNFLKLGRAVMCTAHGLAGLVVDVINGFHSSLVKQYSSDICSRRGSEKVIRQRKEGWHIDCGCGVCEPWMRSIAAESRTSKISWQNTNVDDWPVDPWQLAKVFMSPGKKDSCNSLQDTDPAGILQVMINCALFGQLLDVQKVEVVKRIRNKIMHSPNYAVETSEMSSHILTMIALLQEPAVWQYQCAKDAIDDLRKIEQLDLAVNDNEVVEYERLTWKQKLQALELQQEAQDQELHKPEELEETKQDIVRSIQFLNDHGDPTNRRLAVEFGNLKNQIRVLEENQKRNAIRLTSVEELLYVRDPQRQQHGQLEQVDLVKKEQKEFLTKVLHEKYLSLTVPVQYGVGLDSIRPEHLENVYVDMDLYINATDKFPKKFNYRGLKKEMEAHMQSSDTVPIAKLFSSLEPHLHKTKDHKKVLLQGRPGVGKSTFAKYLVNQWAKGSLWSHIDYVFLVKVKQLPSRKKWSLSELLFYGVSFHGEYHKAWLNVITESPEKVLVILDGYDEGRWTERAQGQGDEGEDLATLVSFIINNDLLPGAQILVCSRPTDQLPMKAFSRVVQLYGFTTDNISDYVRKFPHDEKDGKFVAKCLEALDENQDLAGLCNLPLQCGFVCACLADRFACEEQEEVPAVNTSTSLYVQLIVQLAQNLHPDLKSWKMTQVKKLFDEITSPLIKHANLAKFGITSSPQKFVFDAEDLDKYDFEIHDKKCGILVKSEMPDPRLIGAKKPCWYFNHTTTKEFFAALGLLRSYNEDNDGGWECLRTDPVAVHMKTVVMFMAGLLGDTSHEYFVERLVLEDGQATKSKTEMLKAIIDLIPNLRNDAMIMTTAFETQNTDLIRVVPTEIRSSNMTMTDRSALVWILKNENYHIKSLSLSNCSPDVMKDIVPALKSKQQVHCLELSDNDFSSPEACEALGASINHMTALRELNLNRCSIEEAGLHHLFRGLSKCPKLEMLRLRDNRWSPEAKQKLTEMFGNRVEV